MSSKHPHQSQSHPIHHGAHHGAAGGHPAHHDHRAAHHTDTDEPVLKPPAKSGHHKANNANEAAVNLIRQKLDAIYAEDSTSDRAATGSGTTVAADYVLEPAAQAEIAEITESASPATSPSRHQQFMLDLHNSGKGMAAIQTAWHQYYLGLSDAEKREVWQEFYCNNGDAGEQSTTVAAGSAIRTPDPAKIYPTPTRLPEDEEQARSFRPENPLYQPAQAPAPSRKKPELAPVYQADDGKSDEPAPAAPAAALVPEPAAGFPLAASTSLSSEDKAATEAIRDKIRSRIGSRSQLKVKHHVQSLLFGLGFGGLVVLIVLFSFFNEVVIAPFIQPSRTVSATPIIVSADGITSNGKNEVLIPKINLEIPLDFSAKTIDEKEIENGLDNGVVHYPTTVLPGQQGNAAFFGHSSNNIFNPGKYKFAFVLLHELEPGDTFYLSYSGVVYAYQVFDKKVVEPTDVAVLNPVPGKNATATLITCDPPGTSLRRLVVWGEQVSPNPNGNAVATPTPTASGAEQALPGNGPTLWRRLVNAITGD